MVTARRPAATAGVVGLAAVLAGYVFWASRRPQAAPAPDANVVAVFPFRVVDAGSGIEDLRDWIHDLIAARLTGEGGPRALDPATVIRALGATDQASRDSRAPDAWLRLAEGLGAGWLLHGVVAGSAGGLSLEATLLTVPRGAPGAQARVAGTADRLPQLADRLTAELLASLAARDADEFRAFMRTTRPALQAYLAGRAAYRRGEAAAAYFERALSLDSTFAPAALALAAGSDLLQQTSGPDERWKFDAVWRQQDQLSPADRALLIAYLGPRYPRRSTLAERIAAGQEAALVAPDRAEAWFLAGDNLLRFGSLLGYPEWETRAIDHFRRALALDSTNAHTLDRLLLLAAAAGDQQQVRRYATLYFPHNPNAESVDVLRWAAAIALGDSAALVRLRLRFADMTQMSLQRIVAWGQRHGVALEDASRAAAVLVDRAEGTRQRQLALNRSARLWLNRGRPGEAKRGFDGSEVGFGPRQGVGALDFRIYAALYWDGDTSDAAAAARQLETYVEGGPLRPAEAPDRSSAACALAHWRLAAGDADRVQAALVQARRLAAPTESPEPLATPVCLAAVEAQLAAARADPYAAALARLDSLLREAWNSRDLLLTVGNLIAARLYEARGDLPRALDRVRRRAGWEAFLSTQLREEGRLAALAGDREGAIRAYRHYLALRSDPEPALREDAARVRAELARLELGLSEREVRPRDAR